MKGSLILAAVTAVLLIALVSLAGASGSVIEPEQSLQRQAAGEFYADGTGVDPDEGDAAAGLAETTPLPEDAAPAFTSSMLEMAIRPSLMETLDLLYPAALSARNEGDPATGTGIEYEIAADEAGIDLPASGDVLQETEPESDAAAIDSDPPASQGARLAAATPTPTATRKPTRTPTETATPTASATRKPTKTVTNTPTATGTATQTVTRTPGPLTPSPIIAPLFGVTTRGEWWDTSPNGARSLARQAGVNWLRYSISWAGLQPVRGGPFNPQYQALLDQWFRDAEYWGMIPVVYISTNPSWAAASQCGPIYTDRMPDFVAFLKKVARRWDGDGDYNDDGRLDGARQGRVDYWQLYNEPDIMWTTGTASGFGGCWGGGQSPEAYAQLLGKAWPALHAGNPNAQLVFGGIAGEVVYCPPTWTVCANQPIFNFNINGGDFVDRVFSYIQDPAHSLPDGNQYFDVFDFHYYMAFHDRWDPYGVSITGKANYYKARMAAKGLSRPIICTEAGRRSDPGQVIDGIPGSNPEQSRAVVKLYVYAMQVPLRSLLWFTYSDIYDWATGSMTKWGLLTSTYPYQPKKSYYAYKTLTQMLSTASYASKLPLGPLAEGYLFNALSVGDRSVIWRKQAQPVILPFAVPAGGVLQTTKMYGTPVPITDGQAGDYDGVVNGEVDVVFNPDPLYVDGRPIGTPLPTHTPTPTPWRVNAGDGVYTDTTKSVWLADKAFSANSWGYNGGAAKVISVTINNTSDPKLFLSDRTWSTSATPAYTFTVPDGAYRVTLSFAEVQAKFAITGMRVFTVKINDQAVDTEFDIFSTAGYRTAIDRAYNVSVQGQPLSISLERIAGNPKINAIKIERLGPPWTPTATPTATAAVPETETPTATPTATETPT